MSSVSRKGNIALGLPILQDLAVLGGKVGKTQRSQKSIEAKIKQLARKT
jgi:hypothetical protein